MDDNKTPRMRVMGDTCSTCNKRIEVNDFLFKLRVLTYNGYLDTEICFACVVGWKKEALKEMLLDSTIKPGETK